MNLLDKTTVFAEGLDHPECVIYHPDGTLWAGGEAGQIYRISPDGKKVEEVANTGGFILGLALSPACDWILICDNGNKQLLRLDLATLEISVFSNGLANEGFKIPNFSCFDSAGDVYVSESGDFRSVNGCIYKFDSKGNGQVWCPGPFNFANGIALDQDENYLYVVCSFSPSIERVRIENGQAKEREVFATLPESVPDGLAFDVEGNLYVSCYAPNKIYMIKPDRSVITIVDDWEAHTLSNPTNIAFGGSHFDQLFTANLGRWHISKIDLGIKGLKLVSNHGNKL